MTTVDLWKFPPLNPTVFVLFDSIVATLQCGLYKMTQTDHDIISQVTEQDRGGGRREKKALLLLLQTFRSSLLNSYQRTWLFGREISAHFLPYWGNE